VDNRVLRPVPGIAARCRECGQVEHLRLAEWATLPERGEGILALVARLHEHERVHREEAAT
jgi:hypothetical protein